MGHKVLKANGKTLVSATTLPGIIAKHFLDPWRVKLCHCKTHATDQKLNMKDKEWAVINELGEGHCGYVYGDKIRDDAAEFSTEIHGDIEAYFNGQPAKTPWGIEITKLYAQHGVKPHIVKPEEVLRHDPSNLNGSPDHTLVWDGEPMIGDIKIKNNLDEFTGVQGWIYRYLIFKTYGYDYRKMLITWGHADKPYEVEPVIVDLDEWTDVVVAMTTIWNKMFPKRSIILDLSDMDVK